MLAKSDPLSNFSAAVETRAEPRSPWRLVSIEVLPDYGLRVTFRDGTEGVVDMKSAIFASDAGGLAGLRDAALFARARVEMGAPAWPEDVEIAPDTLYDGVRANPGAVYVL